MKSQILLFLLLAIYAASPTTIAGTSAYAGQETRDIKALDPDEVDAYLTGKGAGMAKAAELNGYAGPAHVLELGTELGLTAEQRARTQALFASMQAQATAPGRKLVAKERQLDAMFTSKNITPEALATTLDEIGALQAQVRRAHLEAHLAEAKILTPEQSALYATLRGYTAGNSGMEHHQHHPMQ